MTQIAKMGAGGADRITNQNLQFLYVLNEKKNIYYIINIVLLNSFDEGTTLDCFEMTGRGEGAIQTILYLESEWFVL